MLNIGPIFKSGLRFNISVLLDPGSGFLFGSDYVPETEGGLHYAMLRKIQFKTHFTDISQEINHVVSHISFDKSGFHASTRRSQIS